MKQQLQWGTKAALNAATPKAIKTIYRLLGLLSMIWVLTIQPNMGLSDVIQAAVNKWLLIGNGAFYQICQAFGYVEAGTNEQ